MIHKGDLIVDSNNIDIEYNQKVTEVTGNLYIQAANASFPALTSVGKGLYIEAEDFDHSRIKFGFGQVLAVSEYALFATADGKYRAGCRGPWDASTCLEHWGPNHHNQTRAQAFSNAIKRHEEASKHIS